MPEPFLFIHIPKTAGTSCRMALTRYFGKKAVWADYGKDAPESHDLVKQLIYQQADMFALLYTMREQACDLLTGHVTFQKYQWLFPVDRVFAFIRDPLSRAVSEYKHFLRLKGYDGSFSDFIRGPGKANTLSRYLTGTPISAFGFLGITEDYTASLNMLNSVYGWNLKEMNLNTEPVKDMNGVYISDEDRQLFEELGRADIDLYQRVSSLYEQRKALFERGQVFTHGEYRIDKNNRLHGFAFRIQQHYPVRLLITLDGKGRQLVLANELHPEMRKLNAPRKGFVGFSLPLGSDVLKGGGLKVTVEDTGQVLMCMGPYCCQ